MNTWNKVFLGVIFVTALVVVVLASVEFQVRNTGQKHIVSMEKKIAETQEKIDKIESGTAPQKLSPEKSLSEMSFEEHRGVLSGRYSERGRAWFGCIVADMDERTLPPALQQVETQIIITGPFAPSETGIATDVQLPATLNGVVYVFEDNAENHSGAFLGRFNVVGEPEPAKFPGDDENEKNGWRITLVTIDPISEGEIEQIFNASNSRWAIYMTPPVDRIAGIFSQLTVEEMQMIPEELREKFKPRPMPPLEPEDLEGISPDVVKIWEAYRSEWDDPEAEFARDFATLLDWLYQQRSGLIRDIRTAEANIETFKTATEKNGAENKKMEEDLALEEKKAAAMVTQRDAVKTLLDKREEGINATALQIEKIQTLSAAYVEGMTKYQLKLVEIIETPAKNSD